MSDRRRSRTELRKGAPAFVDDANTGRRTGKFIPTVQLDEDGFESIEGLFGSQAYAVDAPKQRARKQLATVVEYSYIEEEDEEGASMELTRVEGDVDMDDYDIPEVQPAPAPARRTTIRRSSPPIDDHVPSPQRFSQSSQSTRRAKAPLNSARRSHSIMRSSSPVQPDPEPEEEEEPEPEPEPEPEKSRRRTIARRSTLGNGDHSVDMELDEPTMSVIHEQDEGVDIDVGSPPPSPPKAVKTEKTTTTNKPSSSSGNKSNAASSSNKPASKNAQSDTRALTPTPPPPADDDLEDDIANGLAQLDAGADEEDEPEPEPPVKSGSKAKGKEKEKPAAKGKAKDKGKAKEKRPRDDEEDAQKSPKKAKAGKGKENARETTVEPVGRRKKRDFTASTPPNVRRSQRERFSPLEWWRGEKFVYGRSPDPEEGPLLVPLIRAIERPAKPPTVTLSKKGAKKGGRRVKVKKEEEEERELGEGVFGAPRTQEDGLDEETEELGVVMDYATGREVERRIAFPGARVDFNPSDGPFSFQKIFGDSDFFAAGVMKIPVGGRKPNKPSKENTFVFYCVSGAVEVKIHKSTFTIAPGGMFLAPRGNVYTIANISQRDAYIFFAQSRKVLDDSDEPPPLPREKESLPVKGKARVVPKK
ncbi:unnamed protein product [Rhizoctonia solani]|uniref:CENP-C homolog n=1 Tax=Rhizoctonia solani TaxID=456999 RepID=A0A8H2ZZ92_9AGAM|nr:unnamed protein product [Rhizoctonia solani]